MPLKQCQTLYLFLNLRIPKGLKNTPRFVDLFFCFRKGCLHPVVAGFTLTRITAELYVELELFGLVMFCTVTKHFRLTLVV